VLAVLVQNTASKGGLDSNISFSAYQSVTPINNWLQQGGLGSSNPPTIWQALDSQTFKGPQFFRTVFTASPPGITGANPMWRVTTTGLSHGSVWVNGHNLGRYPEIIPAPDIYIPECWLNAGNGSNTLVIFDESGNRPTQVQIQPEVAASRDVVLFQSSGNVNHSDSP
jgi:beta-galactosidase